MFWEQVTQSRGVTLQLEIEAPNPGFSRKTGIGDSELGFGDWGAGDGGTAFQIRRRFAHPPKARGTKRVPWLPAVTAPL